MIKSHTVCYYEVERATYLTVSPALSEIPLAVTSGIDSVTEILGSGHQRSTILQMYRADVTILTC